MKISKFVGVATAVAFSVCFIIPDSYIFCDELPVHADAGTFSGAIDYIEALSGSDATSLMSTPGGSVVAGLLLGVYLCTRNPLATGLPYDVTSEIYYTGLYTVNGKEKIGCIRTTSTNYYPADGGYIFATSDDWELSTTCGSPIRFVYDGYNERFECRSQARTTQTWNDSKDFFQPFYSGKDWYSVSTSIGYFTAPILTQGSGMPAAVDDWNYRPRLLGQISAVDSLGGELDPANPELYVNRVIRPYVEVNYPDLIYLLPEAPYEPEYPTDFVTGIPKDWTITNPQLPTSPSVDFTIPTADYSVLSPSEAIGDYSNPMSFWWTLTGDTLDTLGIKWFYILAVAIAIIAYIIWQLGR